MASAKAKKKDKKDRKKLFITLGVIALTTLCVVIFVLVAFFKTEKEETFAFSGYVFADGESLAGAKVSCGILQTETDENGYYSFDGLTNVVEVTASKDNYIFGKGLVYVNCDKTDVNFYGFELFSLDGVVRNGDEVIPNATIEVISESGVFNTIANNLGQFHLSNLAGEVKLNAFHDSINLFPQVFDKSKEDLVVSGTTQISGRIDCDSDLLRDFQLKLNDNIIALSSDLKFSATDVRPNSILSLSSENYHISTPQIRVTIENGQFVFLAQKYYDIHGVVRSGISTLSGVRVVVGGKRAISDTSGEFDIAGLYGDNNVSAYYSGFTFNSIDVNNSSEDISLIGTFSIKGKVEVDDNNLGGISVTSGSSTVLTNAKGEFQLLGLELGDVVSVVSDKYCVTNNNITLSEIISPTFELKKLYSATINVSYFDEPLENFVVNIGSKEYSAHNGLITIDGLSGVLDVVLSAEGYIFDGAYRLDHSNNTITIVENGNTSLLASDTLFKYFTLSGVVTSGDIIISDATITIGDKEVLTSQSGSFEISNLYMAGNLTVTADGYDTQVVPFSTSDNIKNITLTYSVSGKITCGNLNVSGVKVTSGSIVDYSTSGEFVLNNLVGNNTISFEKEFYSFDTQEVNSCTELDIDCTYSIRGKVTDKNGAISGQSVFLLKDGINKTKLTNASGEYSYEGLTGEYLLYCGVNTNLQPDGYSVSGGGVYNFSDTGYKLKGVVTSGGVPVSGVSVKAGELITTTNDDGEYKFDLLIKEETIVLSKDGYTFEGNNRNVDSSYEKVSVDFECTYAITGVVASGTTPLQGVEITIAGSNYYTNEKGEYSISGLSGNNSITFQLGEYEFDVPTSISGAGEYNISAIFATNVTISTGNIPVVGAVATLGGKRFETDSNGTVQVDNISIGSTLEFLLDGYSISTYTFSDIVDSISIGASYTVSGTVYLTSSTLGGVVVNCGEQTYTTTSNGMFTFDGVEGSQVLTFAKTDLIFDNIPVAGHMSSLAVNAKYTITGVVTCAGNPLDNVQVVAVPNKSTLDSVSTTTNPQGMYTLILNYDATLEFSKTGYKFVGEYTTSSTANIDVEATYKVKGRVVSGDIAIEDALVHLSDGTDVTTDSNGYFEVEDIEVGVSFSASTDNYNDGEYGMVYGYTQDIVIDLTYNITISLSSITSLQGVEIGIADASKTYNIIGMQILENLNGAQTITISKDGYFFSPSEFRVTYGTSKTIEVKKEFAVYGYITTESGLKASNVTISAGKGKTCVTDENGYYYIAGLIDTPTINLLLNVVDTAWQGEGYSYSQLMCQPSTDTQKDTTIPDFNYAYFLFKNGYQKLNGASSYQIFGSGTVGVKAPVVGTSTQNVSVVYKKDTKGNRLIQNLNYGETIAGVDPRVAQLTYVDTSNKTVKYKTIRNKNNVLATTADWDKDSWHDTTYEKYLSEYGVNAEGYYVYVVNPDTISSIENISLSDGMYSLKINLKESAWSHYLTQMTMMCSSQKFKTFTYCNLTYTIGQDGFIRSMVIDEKYEVTSSGFTATVSNNITYLFKTTSMDDVISDIQIDSSESIKASLLEETPTKATNNLNIAYCKMENSEYNIYSDKRRKFL